MIVRAGGEQGSAMAWWQDDLHDQRIGQYRIEEKLGEGGMAEVFRVTRTDHGETSTYAMKVPKIGRIPPDDLQQVLKRFQRERSLHGKGEPIPHIVSLIDAGEVTDRKGIERPYLVLQFLGGGSLGSRLGGIPGRRTQTQTLSEVIRWLRPIATALDDLHGSVPPRLHRDIKPDNILFNKAGSPFLSDFGIATTLEEIQTASGSGSQPSEWSVGGTPGSPGYQSPESFGGTKTPESDQFSLAVTVYEALSGRWPTRASNRDAYIEELRKWAITPLSEHCPDLPPAAAAVVMKAMSREVQDRFLSCAEFADAFRDAAAVPFRKSTKPETGTASSAISSPRMHEGGQAEKYVRSEVPRVHRVRLVWGIVVFFCAGLVGAFLWVDQTGPSTGAFLIETDAACTLTIDREAKGMMFVTEPRTIDLSPGEHRMTCVSSSNTEVESVQNEVIARGEHRVVTFKLQGRLIEQDTRKAKQASNADKANKATPTEVEEGKSGQEKNKIAKQEVQSSEPNALEKQGSLLVDIDAPCELVVDGRTSGRMDSGAQKVFSLLPGEHSVKCVSTERPEINYQITKVVEAGRQVLAKIGLRATVDKAVKADQEKREETERVAIEKRKSAEVLKAFNDRFQEISPGILHDSETRLDWSSDNGSEVSWQDAFEWCKSKGPGFRLPTPVELGGLEYDKKYSLDLRCGNQGCAVSSKFHLTGYYYWTAPLGGSSARWFRPTYFAASPLQQYDIMVAPGHIRAICVRSD